MEKDWLIEVESNFPRELEITAETKEEAKRIAGQRLGDIMERRMPEFSVGRVTESGENKGFVWNDGD